MARFRIPTGFNDMQSFGLIDALLGRRSRRFFMGAEIPDGIFTYKSNHAPVPLSDFEKLLVVAACGANTGWNNLIYRAQRFAPHLSNYAGAAGGRVFPSAAAVHDEIFKECIALQAQYIYNTFGKFPGTVPSMMVITYLQAHHLDTGFYDTFYTPGAYLKTHADHFGQWHSEESE
ncbi:MAG: hypothetical protein GF401_08715 [Chitinivibrionales bacterium]|nr:hypothetical protein [Chitinivibrionales bacterium]